MTRSQHHLPLPRGKIQPEHCAGVASSENPLIKRLLQVNSEHTDFFKNKKIQSRPQTEKKTLSSRLGTGLPLALLKYLTATRRRPQSSGRQTMQTFPATVTSGYLGEQWVSVQRFCSSDIFNSALNQRQGEKELSLLDRALASLQNLPFCFTESRPRARKPGATPHVSTRHKYL